MMEPVYILIRTSRRRETFTRMMESIKSQTYGNIKTIVHSDDPRDEYVTGDIVIRDSCFTPDHGSASYNLYCNRLLDAIPDGSGWFYFLDDDDMLCDDTVIDRLVSASKRDHINVARVIRWNGLHVPVEWGRAGSFQTECFLLHTDHKKIGRWWERKGGDHYYTRQIVRRLPINWIDCLVIAEAQRGKNNGKRFDTGGNIDPKKKVAVVGLIPCRKGPQKFWVRQGEMRYLPYEEAVKLEKAGYIRITNYGSKEFKTPIRQLIRM